MSELIMKYNLLDKLGQQEVNHFIEFLLSKKSNEQELLRIIHHNFTEEEQNRFDELIAKRQSETITTEELEELKLFSDSSEEIAVERVKALTKLAKLRNTTVRALLTELDVKPRNYE